MGINNKLAAFPPGKKHLSLDLIKVVGFFQQF